jgi:hypothetical protein
LQLCQEGDNIDKGILIGLRQQGQCGAQIQGGLGLLKGLDKQVVLVERDDRNILDTQAKLQTRCHQVGFATLKAVLELARADLQLELALSPTLALSVTQSGFVVHWVTVEVVEMKVVWVKQEGRVCSLNFGKGLQIKTESYIVSDVWMLDCGQPFF